jgi:hypothetical protein
MFKSKNKNLETFEYQGDTLVQVEDNRSSKSGALVVAGSVVLAASNSFALAATDFVTTGAEADMGLAGIAVITLAVVGMGFAFVKKLLH